MSVGIEDVGRGAGEPAQRSPEKVGDESVMGAGEAGKQRPSGRPVAGKSPRDALFDEAGKGRVVRVLVDDAGESVAGGGQDAAPIDPPPGQTPDVLARCDGRPGPEENEGSRRVLLQGSGEEVDALVDDAGHRESGRTGELRQFVEDRKRVAGYDDEVRPVVAHGDQGPVEDGGSREAASGRSL